MFVCYVCVPTHHVNVGIRQLVHDTVPTCCPQAQLKARLVKEVAAREEERNQHTAKLKEVARRWAACCACSPWFPNIALAGDWAHSAGMEIILYMCLHRPNRLRDGHLERLQALQQQQGALAAALNQKTAEAAAAAELRERVEAAEER